MLQKDSTVSTTYMTATGGTITTDGDYKVHTFTTGGTFTVTQVGSIGTIEILVVAGGAGGGGSWGAAAAGGGGGGGAGGLIHNSGYTVTATGYTVTVGLGGIGGAGGGNSPGNYGV